MSPANTNSVWFPLGNPRRTAAIRLFCFAHAGGSAMAFREWQDYFPPEIQVCPVQLPGHSTRLRERPFSRMTPLVEALEMGIGEWLDQPFAIFGHSMGAAIGFELSQRLRAGRGIQPEYLFVAGRRAPHRPFPAPTYHLPEPLFIEELRRLQGTPEEALENPEMLALIVPLLRADFEVIETCAYTPRPPLACPIVAMGGLEDHQVSREDIRAWSEVSTAEFSMHMFPGSHFFLHTARPDVTGILAARLQPLVRNARHETIAVGQTTP